MLMLQILTTRGFLAILWTDSRLAWNPEDYDGITKLQVPADQIWIPDITLLNAAEATESTYINWKTSPP